jgi:peptidoglycan/LPS O-acetylase OafA/YrhL
MKYRPEIDGLRALAVIPVILFHAGFELFSGGFVGVDVFFVISGYLITTILIEDIEKKRFSLVNFYERRARRILPALFFVLITTTFFSYFILYPSDLKEYSYSLMSVLAFVSNVFFWKKTEYFMTEAELIPLLHTWSLAVEEQYYLLFPIFLLLVWHFGKSRVFWIIVVFAIISLAVSEWGWRNEMNANFYLAPTRVWELFAGSIAAFIVQKRGVQSNNTLSFLGLAAIFFAFFVYDEATLFPSIYALVPVVGVVLLVLFADQNTLVAKLLSTRALVGIGLISYSAYLWHQPLFAFYRRLYGIQLDTIISYCLVTVTFVLAFLSWRLVEQPFRDVTRINRQKTFIIFASSGSIIAAVSFFFILTNGADYRYNFPLKPEPWKDIKCHGAAKIEAYENPLSECLGNGQSKGRGDIYLIGDSHAAYLTFALNIVAKKRKTNFFFINTGDINDYPRSFWGKDVLSDRLLDHLLTVSKEGDFFISSFHRGRFNKKRDGHIKLNAKIDIGSKASTFKRNFMSYMGKFSEKGIHVYLVKDGPLLADKDTSIEVCMYEFQASKSLPCEISFEQDNFTRYRQNKVFDELAEKFSYVKTIDYLPLLYNDKNFSPITDEGNYLMFDRHHLTEQASMKLVDFFDYSLKPLE